MPGSVACATRRDGGVTNTSVPARRVERLAVDGEARGAVEHDVELLVLVLVVGLDHEVARRRAPV